MAEEKPLGTEEEPNRAGYGKPPHPKVLASLGGAIIIYVVTQALTLVGFTINDPLKNLINAIAPVVAGYMWPKGGWGVMTWYDRVLTVVLLLAAVALLLLGAKH